MENKMKKIITLFLVVFLMICLCSCGKNSRDDDQTPEPEIHGTIQDFGRFSVMIPDGWAKADLGESQTGFTGVIVHGKAEDFMEAPQVSIMYFIPTEIVLSSRGFYEDTKTLDEFDAAGFHWESWSGTFQELSIVCAEGSGDAGSIAVSLQDFSSDASPMSLDDPEIKAIINSIVVEPTIESDWVSVDNGIATAVLPEVEGYQWECGIMMSGNDVEVEAEIVDGKLVITPLGGNGAFYQTADLENEDGSLNMGTIKVDLGIKDGKVVALYDAVSEIYDEPKEIEGPDFEDNTDYEFLDGFYQGAWVDANNDLTMFIQRADPSEYIYLVTIQSADKNISGTAVIDVGGSMNYTEMSVDGNVVQTEGWFMIDGDMIIWGHDEGVGEFENATIFSKLG